MAHSAGFEPTACRLGGGRSILLSYECIYSKHILYRNAEEKSIQKGKRKRIIGLHAVMAMI